MSRSRTGEGGLVHVTLRLRSLRFAAALTAGLLATLLVSAGASAVPSLSRAQADKIAVRVLRPHADKGDVILFGLAKPLPKGSYVNPADPPKGDPTRKVRVPIQRLAASAWLYWLDRDPYARFSHASEYFLVDDATGHVLRRAEIGWYPLINAKDPPFLTLAGYESKQYRVFARVATPTRAVSAVEGISKPVLTPGAFAGDCVLMVGDFHDAAMRNDFPAVEKWARSVGVPVSYATPKGPQSSAEGQPGPDAGDLDKSVDTLIDRDKCQDILLYMSGHGSKASSKPTVFTGKRVRPLASVPFFEVEYSGVTARDLENVIRKHAKTTFKVKIDSCFSGRFLEDLTKDGKPRQENVLIVEVSSGADQKSLSRPDYRRDNSSPYPDRMGTFTRGNLVGLMKWASSPDEVSSSAALGDSLLAHALERAFTLGRADNYGISKGYLPELATNFLPLQFTRTSWLHATGSVACAEVKSEPGTLVNVGVSTNASVPPQPVLKTVKTGADGLAVASYRIFRAADYAFGATARNGVRTSKALPARLTVPFPAQPLAGSLACPAP